MGGIWQNHQFQASPDICLEEYGTAEHDRHATLRYNDVVRAGSPARPLDFPAPEVFRGERADLRARDHKSGTIHYLKGVILRSSNNNKFSVKRLSSDAAYLVTKKISKTVYGSLNLCIVLKRIDKTLHDKRRSENNTSNLEDRQDDDDCPEWESTDHQAAIKISEWKKIHTLRGKHLEDPIKEIAAMQLLGNSHPHVLGTIEVLQDDTCLYTVMPYLGGGDLYGRLMKHSRHRSQRSDAVNDDGMNGLDETSARIWFLQLLQAVNLLQKKGVCHRDICLENILLDERDNIRLIDPGMSLRVPYTDSGTGGIGDVSAGTSRRLMKAQGQGGKLMYTAPEIIAKEAEIDAFAIDLWSVGVVLFIMIVGLAPFRWAHPTDKRYANISSGRLGIVIDGLGITISQEVRDLLQGFFWAENQKRFTLADIMQHPWVQGKEKVYRQLTLSSKPTMFLGSLKIFSIDNYNLKSKIRSKRERSNENYANSRGKEVISSSSV